MSWGWVWLRSLGTVSHPSRLLRRISRGLVMLVADVHMPAVVHSCSSSSLVMEVRVKNGMRGVMSVVTLTAACLGVGIAAAPAYADPQLVYADPPWQGHCTGEKAKSEEKKLVIQACQRAYSAAARAAAATTNRDTAPAADAEAAAINASSAAKAAPAAAYAYAAANAASTAATAAANADSNAAANADSAGAALDAAAKAAETPTDAALADKAAEAEEKAVKASSKALGLPHPVVKIPRIAPKS